MSRPSPSPPGVVCTGLFYAPYIDAMEPEAQSDPVAPLAGHLWVFVAFDWGDEVNLEQAKRLAAGESLQLLSRPRTPSSFAYKPPPLRFQLTPLCLPLPGLEQAQSIVASGTVFDFGAVSFAAQIPFQMTSAELAALAGRLGDTASSPALVQAAKEALS